MSVLTWTLAVLGVGFLIANLRLLVQHVSYLRRRRGALLTWPSPKPAAYGVALAIGVVMGGLVFLKRAILHRQVFGESMMFLYYAYLLPLSMRIRRGFYEDGIWADTAFIPYHEIGGITWREGEHHVTLIVISRVRNLARRLAVPVEQYGASRRLLRDKIATHAIQFSGTGLDLGQHDEREDV